MVAGLIPENWGIDIEEESRLLLPGKTARDKMVPAIIHVSRERLRYDYRRIRVFIGARRLAGESQVCGEDPSS